MTDALTPRHEAPAEGAGERALELKERIDQLMDERHFPAHLFDTCEELKDIAEELSALRARSSAPEACEEALGNLLAVIHGDGGHRALEVGVEQAAAEAEKIVAGLFAAPSADKLRDVLVDLTSWFTKPVQGQSGMVWVIPAGERGADDALNAALAALKAEV